MVSAGRAGGPPSLGGAEVKSGGFTPGIPKWTGCSADPERHVVAWVGGRGKRVLGHREATQRTQRPRVQGATCALGGPSDSSVTPTGGEPWPARATWGELKMTASSLFTFLLRAGVSPPPP